MSLPNRNNPYTFQDFLQWRDQINYYSDDPFFQQVVQYYTGDLWPELDLAAKKVSIPASFRWKKLAESLSIPEKRPFMTHFDGHNNRIDRIERPMETHVLEKEVFLEGLFSEKTSSWEKMVKMFLIYQNGEAGVSCPLTCTEGMVGLLEYYADTPELQKILTHCKEGVEGDFGIGAQYLSEIQGGSDVPSNLLEAEQKDGVWRLYGTKFFCSATHADYSVVTAKSQESEKPSLFIVPSWLPGNKEKEIRNGFCINRIKWKMGTSELPTAEIVYDGAVAYPVGPMEKGVANVTAVVLTYSRLTVALTAAAYMTRAVREAKKYSKLREAFGIGIGQFPLVKGQLNSIEKSARRTLAGTFKLHRDFIQFKNSLQIGLGADEPIEIKKKRFLVRELVMLQKITASWDCIDILRTAMSIFGGHGVMEDFSSLPRLFRDAAINELWEGPRNVLLTQIHRDLQRVASWYSPHDFAADVLNGAETDIICKFGQELTDLTENVNLLADDEKTIKICIEWDQFCHRFFHAYQDLALSEVVSKVS